MNDPLVSICMITFNHARFIREAIEGVLNQKTSFPIELVIGEDHSNDQTLVICQEYEKKYPDIIKLLTSMDNLGMHRNFFNTLTACKGKYIAICEGDDFWTDPCKLQKQANFLEGNPEYGLICSDINVVNEHSELIDSESLHKMRKRYQSGYVFFAQLEGSTINTLTACFRKELISELFSYKDIWYLADWWLWLRISMKANVKHMDEITANYRRHCNNITSTGNLTSIHNRKVLFNILYDNILYFSRHNKMKINMKNKQILIRNIIRLLIRKEGNIFMKINIIPLFIKYFSFKVFLIIINQQFCSYK